MSHAISEGDGISLIARVSSADAARAAEEAGAEGLTITAPLPGLPEATPLPVLWRGGGRPRAVRVEGADAWVVTVAGLGDEEGGLEELNAEILSLGLEPVVEVRDERELELALERIDPEIFLLSGGAADGDEERLDRVLALLPDVPAGKLAIAAGAATREDVLALERAGVDGVLVEADDVARFFGGEPPAV